METNTNIKEVTIKKVFGKTKNDRFPVKLEIFKGYREVLGHKEEIRRTYYIMVNHQVTEGATFSLDFNQFNIVVNTFKTKNDAGEEIEIPTKWLIRKGAEELED